MSRTRFIWLSMIVDALTFNAGVVAAFLIRFGGELPAYNVGPYVTLAPYLTLILLLVAYVYGLYDPERIEGVWPLVRGAFAAAAVTMLLTLGVLQLAGQSYDAFPRLVIVLAAPLHLLLLFGWRVGAMRLTPVRWRASSPQNLPDDRDGATTCSGSSRATRTRQTRARCPRDCGCSGQSTTSRGWSRPSAWTG
jgi:hypothetical protein